MADYNTISGIKQRINDEIYENHAEEITGPILNQVLDDIVDTIAMQGSYLDDLQDVGDISSGSIIARDDAGGSFISRNADEIITFAHTALSWNAANKLNLIPGNISHKNIADIGNYAHSDIDAFINSKGNAGGLASLNTDGKVPTGQLPNSILEYLGTWNADTNTPALSDGDSTNAGHVYRVSVAGSTDFGSGSISFKVGDYCIADKNGTWEKADTTDAVSSINGYTGDVTLDTDDVSEGSSNLYYTNTRVKNVVTTSYVNNLNVDADTLDGQEGSYYLNANNLENFPVPNWKQKDDTQNNYVEQKPLNDIVVGYIM